MCNVDVSKFCLDFENFWNKKTNRLKIIIVNHYLLIWVEFRLLKEMYSSNELLSTCSIEKSFASMMKIETINCFLTTQSIISSNNLKIYSSALFRLRSFTKNASIVFSKICLFLFDEVFLFNIEFDVDDISLFELEIWLLSFSLFEFE